MSASPFLLLAHLTHPFLSKPRRGSTPTACMHAKERADWACAPPPSGGGRAQLPRHLRYADMYQKAATRSRSTRGGKETLNLAITPACRFRNALQERERAVAGHSQARSTNISLKRPAPSTAASAVTPHQQAALDRPLRVSAAVHLPPGLSRHYTLTNLPRSCSLGAEGL